MRLLFLGDIVGRPGRQAVVAALPRLVERFGATFVVANCENVAAGRGVDPKSVVELLRAGVHVLTSGNHVWQKREIVDYVRDSDLLLRPANYPPGAEGYGWTTRRAQDGTPVAVVNLLGRVFMGNWDCPFRTADEVLSRVREQAKVIVVDMHAEATSEKVAMGWRLAGKVSAVIGSHTHVQTADETLLPGGTAYITDAGMCGPIESVIGMRREQAIEHFLTARPVRLEVADGPVGIQGVVIDVDPGTGRATGISRIREVCVP